MRCCFRMTRSETPRHWGRGYYNIDECLQPRAHPVMQIQREIDLVMNLVGRRFAHQRFADSRIDSQKNAHFGSTWPDSCESRLLSDSHWNSRNSRPILAAIPFFGRSIRKKQVFPKRELKKSQRIFARIGPLRSWNCNGEVSLQNLNLWS